VRNERIFESVAEELKRNESRYKGRWDTPARRIFGPVLREVFRQSFPKEDDRTSVYVEGEEFPNRGKNPVNSSDQREYTQTLQS